VGAFIGRPSVKLFQELLALDWKQCRLVTELLIGHHTLRWHIHIMGLSEITKYRKCGQQGESSDRILCQFPALTGSEWLQLIDFRSDSGWFWV
jgi:hypothetical protein